MNRNPIATACKLVGVALCLLFFSQLAMMQLEHAGLLDCDSAHAADASGSNGTKDLPVENCHHVCCNAPCFFPNGVVVSSPFHGQGAIHPADELIPDGPVKSIDHPPQLS